MSPREVIGIGWDVAGRVDEVGPGVTAFAPGDRVIGLRDRLDLSLGTYAEFVVLDATAVAPAPTHLSAVEAATLPLNGVTAGQSLDLLALEPGATLLVTGAAGAVGGYAVELAALRGVRVVGYAGADDEELVRALGARWFVPRSADLATAVRELIPGGVDTALDAAVMGLPALAAVRNRGTFVAVIGGAAPLPLRGIAVVKQWVAADTAALTQPLQEAAQAHQRLAKGGLRGRLVLTP